MAKLIFCFKYIIDVCFRSDGTASESQSQCCLDEEDSNSKSLDDSKYEQPLVKYGELVILG
jgi:hypothetical protein